MVKNLVSILSLATILSGARPASAEGEGGSAPTASEATADASAATTEAAAQTPPAAVAPREGSQNASPGAEAAVVRSKGALEPLSYLRLFLNAESGFTFVGKNSIQFGRVGPRLDYVREGGQDNLLPFLRLSAEARLFDRHSFIFLYQPLGAQTQTVLPRTFNFDNVVFPSGTAVNAGYGFDFYRFSYLYDLLADEKFELSVGVSLQIRNANISFTSVDGALRTVNNDIGFVPILKVRSRYTFDNGMFLGLEADAIYVSGKMIPTGRNANDFEASLYDLSVRAGSRVTDFAEIYGNLRVLGGGARATEKNPRPGTDGFSENWLNTVILSLGATIH